MTREEGIDMATEYHLEGDKWQRVKTRYVAIRETVTGFDLNAIRAVIKENPGDPNVSRFAVLVEAALEDPTGHDADHVSGWSSQLALAMAAVEVAMGHRWAVLGDEA